MKVWALVKETRAYGSDETHWKILGTYSTAEGLGERLERIQRANAQYPLVPAGKNRWRIGPEEDEGFFGRQPVWLIVVETTLE